MKTSRTPWLAVLLLLGLPACRELEDEWCLPLSPECARAEAQLRVDVQDIPAGTSAVVATAGGQQRRSESFSNGRTSFYFFDLPEGGVDVLVELQGAAPSRCAMGNVATGDTAVTVTVKAASSQCVPLAALLPDAGTPDAAPPQDAATPDATQEADAGQQDGSEPGDAGRDGGDDQETHPDAGTQDDAGTSPPEDGGNSGNMDDAGARDAGAADGADPQDAGSGGPQQDGGGMEPRPDGGMVEPLPGFLLISERRQRTPASTSLRTEVVGSGEIFLSQGGQSWGSEQLLPQDVEHLQELARDMELLEELEASDDPCEAGLDEVDLRLVTHTRDAERNVAGCTSMPVQRLVLELARLRDAYFQ